jgi:hypothetical protein
MSSVSISASPSICRPPQTPSTRPPRAAWAATAASSPRALGHRARPDQPHAANLAQRLEFVQVADARVGKHGDLQCRACLARGLGIEHAVFLGQAMVAPHGQRGEHGHAGERLQLLGRGRQQRLVTTEFVEHEAGQARAVGLGLEQERVHAHVGPRARRQRLKVLGRADFAQPAIGRGHHPRVVAHVLRLEGAHHQALAGIPAAQRRGQPALAGAAGRAQHHDSLGSLAHCFRSSR